MKYISTKQLEWNDGTILYVDIFQEGQHYFLYNSYDGEELELIIDGKLYQDLDINGLIEFYSFTTTILEVVEHEKNNDNNLCLN